MPAPNLLETGIFTVSEAAHLVGAHQQRVRGWISGYPRRHIGPIVDNELGYVGEKLAFSFTNLMEVMFIAFFENAGLKLQHIRAIMHEARGALEHPHPFATKTVFLTDGKRIIAEITEKHGGQKLLDLKSRNWEMRPIVYDSLKKGVIYDPSGIAVAWKPRPETAPNVIIAPKFSFGQPILKESRIPTRTISQAVAAEGGIRAVAQWFEIPQKQVIEAHKFELSLRLAKVAGHA